MTSQWERDIRRFTEGDCHVLARALHVRAGWPIGVTTLACGEIRGHAFVIRPDGLALDIEGLWYPAELVDRYGAQHWRRVDWATLRNCCGTPHYGPYSYRRACIVADDLLRRFGC